MSVNPIQEKTIYSDIQLFSYFFHTPEWGEKIHPYIYNLNYIYRGGLNPYPNTRKFYLNN